MALILFFFKHLSLLFVGEIPSIFRGRIAYGLIFPFELDGIGDLDELLLLSWYF
jgi:hypothetical protein